MAIFQCNNEDCIDPNVPIRAYLFEADEPICPKCQNDPQSGLIGTAVVIHFCCYQTNGKLKGLRNKRIAVACNVNMPHSPFSLTTSIPCLVTCPACKREKIYRDLWYPDPHNISDYINNPNKKQK